jgi:FkbM family methyltransferase
VSPPGWSPPPVLMANNGSDHVASMLFWRGVAGWEPTTVRLFLGLLGSRSTVIDVGANSGLFSLLAARHDPTVRVHALEPVGRVFALLETNVALNGLSAVTCHRVACGDAAGRVTMHVPADDPVPMMASLVDGWCPGSHLTEEVDCVTVDSLVDLGGTGSRRVDVIKVDAEGSEDAVLRGAATTLERHRPFIFCEVLARGGLEAAVTEALSDHDYCFFALGAHGARRCPEVRGGIDDDESHNYLFAPRSRLAQLEPVLAGITTARGTAPRPRPARRPRRWRATSGW